MKIISAISWLFFAVAFPTFLFFDMPLEERSEKSLAAIFYFCVVLMMVLIGTFKI